MDKLFQRGWDRVMTQRLLFSFLLMLVSPVISLTSGLRSTSQVYKRWLIIIFITIYGSVILLPELADGTRHWESVYTNYLDLSLDEYIDGLYHILVFEPKATTNDDVYIHTLSFFVGSILNAPQLFFVFVAFVYAYFFSGAMLKVLNGIKSVPFDAVFYGFVLVFFLWVNIEGINTVRTWTGLWVLFYAAINYFETKKIKFIVLILLVPLIHVGYFIMVIPTCLVLIFGARTLTYSIVFALSFVLNFLNQGAVVNQMEETELGERKVKEYYIGDEAPKEFSKTNNQFTWYFSLYKKGVQNWAINLVAASLIIFGFYFKQMNSIEQKLFSIGILTKALSNSTWFLFALGNRSGILAGIFILATLVLLWKRGGLRVSNIYVQKLIGFVFFVTLIMFIPFLLFRIADIIYYLSIFILAFPFVAWVLPENNISIREALGNLIQ